MASSIRLLADPYKSVYRSALPHRLPSIPATTEAGLADKIGVACDWATLCTEFSHCHHHYHRRLAAKKFGRSGGTSSSDSFYADEPAVLMTVRSIPFLPSSLPSS
jgi:hypothetical protein